MGPKRCCAFSSRLALFCAVAACCAPCTPFWPYSCHCAAGDRVYLQIAEGSSSNICQTSALQGPLSRAGIVAENHHTCSMHDTMGFGGIRVHIRGCHGSCHNSILLTWDSSCLNLSRARLAALLSGLSSAIL